MNPIHHLTIIAAGLSQFMADATASPQTLQGLIEGVSKIGVTGVLVIAVWHFKKQGEMKDELIAKRDAALEEKDREFRAYILKESEAKSILMTECRDVMRAVLAKLHNDPQT